MDKYLIKRPRKNMEESESSPIETAKSIPHVSEDIEPQFDLDDITSDPGLRKPIDEYHVDSRDHIRRKYISQGPCQPFGHNFRKRSCGKEMRAFRYDWFKQFDWLDYSVSKDAVFCFYCYLFRPNTSARYGDDVFVSTGFTNWKKAMFKFKEHCGGVNSLHNKARIMLENYKNQKQSLPHNIRTYNHEAAISYRARLTAVLQVVRMLLRQGLSFRGHDETPTSLNRGNFLEFLTWISETNPKFQNCLFKHAPGNNQMTAHSIQKQMIKACATETTNVIKRELGERSFTLLVDECRDTSVKEQMAVVIRYVNEHGEVIERFLAVVHVAETKAVTLKFATDWLFAEHSLSLSRLRGQGYDGASNMRGKLHGLKSLILAENSSAKYVHCFAHQLQLVVVAVCTTHQHVSDFFGIVRSVVNMSASSCQRADKLRQLEHDRLVQGLGSGDISSGKGKNQETSLARPGDTRWGSHYRTLLCLLAMWPSVIEVLGNVRDDGNAEDSRGSIRTLLIRMGSYDFVFTLHLMKLVLGMTNELSLYLQERDQNILQAMHSIRMIKSDLQNLRLGDDGWNSFLAEVETFCNVNMIEVPNMEGFIQSWLRQRRDGQRVTNHHHYRVEIFCEVLDLIKVEMEERFPEISTDLLTCVACLDPRDSFSRFDLDKLLHLADLYPEDFQQSDRLMLSLQLQNYIRDVRSDSEFLSIRDLETLSKKMVATGKSRGFYMVYRMIELALLLPVATASVERVFSAMNIVKTDLRNRMSDEWLNDSLVVYIEKRIFNAIDDETILQKFQSMDTRTIQLS